MSLELKEDNGRRIYVARRGETVLGFVAVDSTVAGRARGGLRMLSDVGQDEVSDAAHAMTLKYGFLGLPQGGAKAGVRGDGETGLVEKRERLLEFGREIRSLLESQIYVPDADLGTSAADIRRMMMDLGIKVAKRDWCDDLSGFYTAASCLVSAETILRHRGQSLAGQTVAVEGFGSVGGNLARMMSTRGARVVAVSTSQGALYDRDGLDTRVLSKLAAEYGSAFVKHSSQGKQIDRSALLELDVDLLCPCARRHSIDKDNVSRIGAELICAGANNPVDPDVEELLFERGIVFPPDFVTNSGGVLGGTLQFAGVSKDRVVLFIDRLLKARWGEILSNPASSRQPLRDLIEPKALARHEGVCSAAENPTATSRIFALGLAAYRRRLLPKAFVSLLAPMYIRRLQER
jgi:glutamate dehydrogenase/leucine dehydrogenase